LLQIIHKDLEINKTNINLLIIGELKTVKEKKKLNKYITEIKKLKFIKNVDIQSKTMIEDFITLMTLPRLILSVSTFSYWAALLNPYLQECFIPMFGLTKIEIAAENWESSNKTLIFHTNI
jgi:hypothetical protein